MFKHSANTDHKAMPQLIIFDFDGTLAETEALIAKIASLKLKALGVDIEARTIAETFAIETLDDDVAVLERLLNRALHLEFMDEVRADVRASILNGLEATPGSFEVLSILKVPFCVASNASRADLIRRLRAAGLFELVGPRFFSAHDVGVKKPDPGVFLLAAEAMGVKPQDCLVVEDSMAGIQAARRASMRYVAFAGASHHSEQSRRNLFEAKPEAMLVNMGQLLAYLEKLGQVEI
ncbi:HAD family hydrolase [Rhizobium tubonense]|uniref:Hydrolase n=1 Tax=Rhizobium tubonense TaxID=484088 RepID=A0A2W4CJ49_9HYPH|nr:HAD family phosphatase [Rhizobium tubonense]PZM12962.1 hypothetical protein CPY51_15635 [Rhizobium tubonense]